MYLKDSKTVVIKIGSSLLISDKKVVREKWLKEFAKDNNSDIDSMDTHSTFRVYIICLTLRVICGMLIL